MKRKLFSLLLCLLLCSILVVQAAASDSQLVIDEAALFTDEEQTALEDTAQALTDTYSMDVVILTVDSLGGKAAYAYADDYYDRNGFASDGILFLLAMEEREWYISTCGDAIFAFTDYGLDSLGEAILPYLSSEDYYYGFENYLTYLPEYFDAYLQGTPIDGYVDSYDLPYREDVAYYEQEKSFSSVLFTSVMIGLVAAVVSILVMRSSMNTKRKQHSAADYLKQGTYYLRTHQDLFLYSNVTKTRRQQSSGGSHRTGSSVRRSSGGRRHGGRGGRF